MNEKALCDLYSRCCNSPGWMSYLLEAGTIDSADVPFLEWLDDCQSVPDERIRAWVKRLHRVGGIDVESAQSPQEERLALISRIREIDDWCSVRAFEVAEAYRTHCNYASLVARRARISLGEVLPSMMSEAQVTRAREYRLDDLLEGRLNRGFMLCPAHNEKSPSFFVTSFGHCFGCGKTLNSIGWLMEVEQMTFRQAVAHLNGI